MKHNKEYSRETKKTAFAFMLVNAVFLLSSYII